MTRPFLLASLTAGLMASSAAWAQTASTASPAFCPRSTVKIYFAAGDVTASPQAQALIGKIGETATSCGADHIDLITRFDPGADGDRALAIALERLSAVVADLVSRGISVDRIRISAQAVKAGEHPAGHLNQVDVLFRKAGEAPDEAPPPAPMRAFRSDAI